MVSRFGLMLDVLGRLGVRSRPERSEARRVALTVPPVCPIHAEEAEAVPPPTHFPRSEPTNSAIEPEVAALVGGGEAFQGLEGVRIGFEHGGGHGCVEAADILGWQEGEGGVGQGLAFGGDGPGAALGLGGCAHFGLSVAGEGRDASGSEWAGAADVVDVVGVAGGKIFENVCDWVRVALMKRVPLAGAGRPERRLRGA